MKTMYTARATADDAGRNGHAATDDGNVDVDLAMPVAMGGPGGPGTNPEQLFAVGYAACFANALRSAARKLRKEDAAAGATVTFAGARFVADAGGNVTVTAPAQPGRHLLYASQPGSIQAVPVEITVT